VLGDSGAIGGDFTHEFMVLADTGESVVISCPSDDCAYAATDETAESVIENISTDGEPKACDEVHTPGMKTVEDVCSFLKAESHDLVKTILYRKGDEVVGALVRGDREICEPKLLRALKAELLDMADAETVADVSGAEVGFAGPVGLQGVKLVADKTVMEMKNFITGANKTDYHLTNVNPGRDFSPDIVADISLAKAGDKCVRCGQELTQYRGIEVGQVFKLGGKYSKAMNAVFTEEDGSEVPFLMGCYGIGVTRTAAAAIEQNHDENGIIWPRAIAPYHVLITPISSKDEELMSVAEKIYAELLDRGIETLLDDRDERPGVKFKDGDLIGIPLRVTVGSRGLKQGKLEVRFRRSGETREIPLDQAVDKIIEMLKEVD
jgi:prolyl-tRNA synthetase